MTEVELKRSGSDRGKTYARVTQIFTLLVYSDSGGLELEGAS